MKGKNKLILIVLCLLMCTTTFAQAIKRDTTSLDRITLLKYTILNQDAHISPRLIVECGLSDGEYFQSIICRTEWKVEQVINLPLRIRLGSLKYTDMMEGKYRILTSDLIVLDNVNR